jgi:hypothetical protein
MARQVIDLTTPQPGGRMGEPTASAWAKVNDMTADLYSTWGYQGQIDGFKATFNASNNLTFGPGVAYIPGISRPVISSTPIVVAGITAAAASWVHFYLAFVSGAPVIEYSSTGPAAPYSGTARTKNGDTTRRYLCSLRTIAANQIAQFYHNEKSGLVNYVTDINNTFLRVLVSGASTTTAGVDCTSCVPVSSRVMVAISENMAANTGAVAYISNSDNGPAGPTAILSFIRVGAMITAPIVLDANQAFNYARAISSTQGLAVWCTGYVFER